MPISVCIAGTTGWTGSVVARHALMSDEFEVVGAIARQSAGKDLGAVLGLPPNGISVSRTLDEVCAGGTTPDVLIDYTDPASVKPRTFEALGRGIRVVIGTSGLTAADFAEIEREASARRLGVVAAGNFSITAALAKHFSLLAARHLPSWEIIDYASASKIDAPSGTTQELAESMGEVAQSELAAGTRPDSRTERSARRDHRLAPRFTRCAFPDSSSPSRRSSDCRTNVSPSATMQAQAPSPMQSGRSWRSRR